MERVEEDVVILFEIATDKDGGDTAFALFNDKDMANVVLMRLLKERNYSPAQMLWRVMLAPAYLCADLFRELAAFYQDNREHPEWWNEFGEAAGELPVEEYLVRGMDKVAFPLIRRAIGIEEEEENHIN